MEKNDNENIEFIDFSSLDDFEDRVDIDNEMMPQYIEYYHLRLFLFSFVDKAIAVDPLDRPIWCEENEVIQD